MVQKWNFHRICPSKNQNGPSGRPAVMYTVPSIYETRSHLQQVDRIHIQLCQDECQYRDNYPCDEDIFELSTIIMEENGWRAPLDVDDAVLLYRIG